MRFQKMRETEPLRASALFGAFFISNTVLSYSGLSFEMKFWVFFLGVFIPLVIGLWQERTAAPGGPFDAEESLPPVSRTTVVFLLLAAIAVRFLKLSSIPLWPSGDEALQGLFGIELLKSWNWKFFYTVGQHPPLAVWLFSFCVRFFQSSLFMLRFLPAVFSALTVLAGYGASRNYFSKSFSLIAGCLLGFSFWPIFSGRFYLQFIPFWELTAFWLLALFLKEKRPSSQKAWAALLGFWTGLGSLTYSSWILVILAVAATVLFSARAKPAPRWSCPGYFFAFLGLALVPFALAVGREGFGAHILEIMGSGNVVLPDRRWIVFCSYFTSLFWGSLDPGASYGPVWGGLLNPVLASFFFLGIIEMFRWRNHSFIRWTAFCFLLFMLPGFMAADYTVMFRVIQAIAIVLLIVAFGFRKTLLELNVKKRLFFFFLFVLLSAVPDLYQWVKPSLEERGGPVPIFKTEIPDESFRAFKILEGFREKAGPGIIFTDFMLLSHNHTLYVATYPFNASCNRALHPEEAKWAAVLVNINYAPFLARRFEGFEVHPLGLDLFSDGGLMVGMIPLTPGNQKKMEGWLQAQQYFHDLNIEAEDILQSPSKYKKAVGDLPSRYCLKEDDPFLKSCFYEWMAQYHYAFNSYGKNEELIERAIQEGYPSAHLYFKLGNFLLLDRKLDEAKRAYQSAIRCQVNQTMASDSLASLKAIK